jgi:hypothetical protein
MKWRENTAIAGSLIILVAMMYAGSLHGQVVESKPVRILLNNAPDTDPPEIKVMTPVLSRDLRFQTGQEQLDLIGEVKDASGVKFISVNSDIRNINDAGVFSSRLQLQPGENIIRLVAADFRENMVEQTLRITYQPPVITLSDRIHQHSTYYGLIIGIDRYRDPDLPDLEYPIQDAERLYRTLTEYYSFRPSNMLLLKNPERDEIVYALDDLSRKVTPEDNVLIFYAGHGQWDEKANVGYWLPSDAFLSNTANWFRNSTLVDYLKTIDSRHTLLITDACFAGSIFQHRSGFAKQEKAYEVLYDLASRKAMTSGTLTEVPDRSSFTRYLIDRLIENQQTYLSAEQLFSSFRIAVINNSDAIPQFGEIRNVGDEGGDFIFLKKREGAD